MVVQDVSLMAPMISVDGIIQTFLCNNDMMVQMDCIKCGANVIETDSSSKILICEICEYVQ